MDKQLSKLIKKRLSLNDEIAAFEKGARQKKWDKIPLKRKEAFKKFITLVEKEIHQINVLYLDLPSDCSDLMGEMECSITHLKWSVKELGEKFEEDDND